MGVNEKSSYGMLEALDNACKYGSMIVDTYKRLIENEYQIDDISSERKKILIERLGLLSELESSEYMQLKSHANYLTDAANFLIKNSSPKKEQKNDDDTIKQRVYDYIFVLLSEMFLESEDIRERKVSEIEVINQVQKAIKFKKVDLILGLIAEGKIKNVKEYQKRIYKFAMVNKDAEQILLKNNFKKLPYEMPLLHEQNCKLPDEEIKKIRDNYVSTEINSLLYILKALQSEYNLDTTLEEIALFKAQVSFLSPNKLKELERKIIFDDGFMDANIKKEILDIITESQKPKQISVKKNLNIKGDK